MARKMLTFAQFQPPLWSANPPDADTGNSIAIRHTVALSIDPSPATSTPNRVLDVRQDAPEGVKRAYLRTRVMKRQDTPHDAFSALLVTHDTVQRLDAYADSDGQADSDEVEERIYIQPKQFPAYEFNDVPGQLYMAASDALAAQMLRRFKDDGGRSDTVRNRRIVRLGELEGALTATFEAETFGYKLLDVQSSTPIRTYDVIGQQIADNEEVQDAKTRAREIRALMVILQSQADMLYLQITHSGAVTFLNYPGDESALEILRALEDTISANSDLESIAGR